MVLETICIVTTVCLGVFFIGACQVAQEKISNTNEASHLAYERYIKLIEKALGRKATEKDYLIIASQLEMQLRNTEGFDEHV